MGRRKTAFRAVSCEDFESFEGFRNHEAAGSNARRAGRFLSGSGLLADFRSVTESLMIDGPASLIVNRTATSLARNNSVARKVRGEPDDADERPEFHLKIRARTVDLAGKPTRSR